MKTTTLQERVHGARTGYVFMRDFDLGMFTTMGASLGSDAYTVPVTGSLDVPVIFANPEQVLEDYLLPSVVVRRDDMTLALNRLHPGLETYRVAATGASSVEVTYNNNGIPATATGHDGYEVGEQAHPFDFTYTLSLFSRYRNQLNTMLRYMVNIFKPYHSVSVKDTLDETRSYSGFMESISNLDEITTINDRAVGFSLSVRVEGELDFHETAIDETDIFTTPSPVVSNVNSLLSDREDDATKVRIRL